MVSPAALVALIMIPCCVMGATAAVESHLSVGVTSEGVCKLETFCEQWMCKQNLNRKCRIASYLGVPDCTASPTHEAAVNAAWAECNATQSDESMNKVTCDIAGVGIKDVGRNWIVDSCARESPPQLADAGKLVSRISRDGGDRAVFYLRLASH